MIVNTAAVLVAFILLGALSGALGAKLVVWSLDLVAKDDADAVHLEITEDITDLRESVRALDSSLALTRTAVSEILVARSRADADRDAALKAVHSRMDALEQAATVDVGTLTEIAGAIAEIGASFQDLAAKIA